jgi:hypothetical protein
VAETLASELTSSSTVTLRVLVASSLEVEREWEEWRGSPGGVKLLWAVAVWTSCRSLLGEEEIDRAGLVI